MIFFSKGLLQAMLLTIPLVSLGQNDGLKFPLEYLRNPEAYSSWFDSSLNVVETPVFDKSTSCGYVLLENGYAKHELMDVSYFQVVREFLKPVSVDIIFTKYPVRKEDWITNYYQLLAARLTALFNIDSNLNSSNIEWRIIYQTACATESEAEKLFHGIQVGVREVPLAKINHNTSIRLPVNPSHPSILCSKSTRFIEFPKTNEDSLRIILYPEGVWNRKTGYTPPEKNKRTDEPDCPEFRTRMDKPKRSLIDRLLGR
ncbi:MAG TPA: hypothetical protein PLM76_01530 [Tenuifilaceae bacterium]|nr:hypothetical protein [Tenuifilaceae bacterium]